MNQRHPGPGGHRDAVRRRRGDGGVRRAVPAAPTTRTARWPRPRRCTPCRRRSTSRGRPSGLPPFGLGIGLSTGEAAAALLGSAERLEYTLVGDTVNLSQRCSSWPTPGETVLSARPRWQGAERTAGRRRCPSQLVKGRDTPVKRPTGARRVAGRHTPSNDQQPGGGHDEREPVAALVGARRAQDLRGRERAGPGAARGEPDRRARASSSP